jgi:exonuclease SbcC
VKVGECMAISRKNYKINDFGLSQSVRRRIDDLVGLQLTPSTINLFTSEFSQMDENIKLSIGMYIAQLLEIETDLLQRHFADLREQTVHGNSRDRLILEQRKTNLQRIQQIFTKELKLQERISKKIQESEERNLTNDLYSIQMSEARNAMLTNPLKGSTAELERQNAARIANIRRNKELYDFEIDQLNKLIEQHKAAGNVQRVLDLQNKAHIIEQEYLLRRENLLRTINGQQLHNVTPTIDVNHPSDGTLRGQVVPQIDFIDDDESFFDVDTIEINKVMTNNKKAAPKAPKKPGKNKKSDIPNEVLSDNTVEISNIVVPKDITNPKHEIDKILSEVENMSISFEDANVLDDPFLMLLAQDQDNKAKDLELFARNYNYNANKKKPKEEVKAQKAAPTPKVKVKPAKKPVAKKAEPKKVALKKAEPQKPAPKAPVAAKALTLKQQNELAAKNQKIHEKNREIDEFKRERKQLKDELNQLRKALKVNDNAKPSATSTDKALIEKYKKENNVLHQKLVATLEKLEKLEAKYKATTPAPDKKLEKEVQALKAKLKTLEAKKPAPTAKPDRELQKEVQSLRDKLKNMTKKAPAAPTKKADNIDKYVERIKALEDANKELKKSLKAKPTTNDINSQKKKAGLVVKSLESIYIERLKGINALHTLRNRNKEQYDKLEKDNSLKVEATLAVNNLLLKEKSNIIKKDLEKKEKIQEFKHAVLANEDKTGLKELDTKAPTVADTIINETLSKIEPYSKNWVPNADDNDDLEKIDSTIMDIDTSMYRDDNDSNQDAVLQIAATKDREEKEMHRLERRAHLNIISDAEKVTLNELQAKYKKKNSLKNYRLITSFKNK